VVAVALTGKQEMDVIFIRKPRGKWPHRRPRCRGSI